MSDVFEGPGGGHYPGLGVGPDRDGPASTQPAFSVVCEACDRPMVAHWSGRCRSCRPKGKAAETARRETQRRDRAARAEVFDLQVLAFLAESADGARHLGALLARFGNTEELDEALYRLEGKRQLERFQGLEFHVTALGRSRVGGRATSNA